MCGGHPSGGWWLLAAGVCTTSQREGRAPEQACKRPLRRTARQSESSRHGGAGHSENAAKFNGYAMADVRVQIQWTRRQFLLTNCNE